MNEIAKSVGRLVGGVKVEIAFEFGGPKLAPIYHIGRPQACVRRKTDRPADRQTDRQKDRQAKAKH